MRYSLDGQEAAEAYVRAMSGCFVASLPGSALDEARVTCLDAGIMNYVCRIDAPHRTLFLKQALERPKRHDRIGPDLAGVPPSRIRVEWQALRVLADALPSEHQAGVPRACWYDDENNVLWTEGLAPGARSLQEALEQGKCDLRAAGALGRLLAAVHGSRFGQVRPLWSSAGEDAANWDRFLRMRTLGVLERAELPPVAEAAVRALYDDARRHERPGMLSHLDAAPKNVLLWGDGAVALLDFELGAAISDPAYDPGFLAGHYLLLAENTPGTRPAARTAVDALAREYAAAGLAVDGELVGRIVRYAGVTMLYRLYGSSRAPYLSPERYPAIREEGIRLLLGGRW